MVISELIASIIYFNMGLWLATILTLPVYIIRIRTKIKKIEAVLSSSEKNIEYVSTAYLILRNFLEIMKKDISTAPPLWANYCSNLMQESQLLCVALTQPDESVIKKDVDRVLIERIKGHVMRYTRSNIIVRNMYVSNLSELSEEVYDYDKAINKAGVIARRALDDMRVTEFPEFTFGRYFQLIGKSPSEEPTPEEQADHFSLYLEPRSDMVKDYILSEITHNGRKGEAKYKRYEDIPFYIRRTMIRDDITYTYRVQLEYKEKNGQHLNDIKASIKMSSGWDKRTQRTQRIRNIDSHNEKMGDTLYLCTSIANEMYVLMSSMICGLLSHAKNPNDDKASNEDFRYMLSNYFMQHQNQDLSESIGALGVGVEDAPKLDIEKMINDSLEKDASSLEDNLNKILNKDRKMSDEVSERIMNEIFSAIIDCTDHSGKSMAQLMSLYNDRPLDQARYTIPYEEVCQTVGRKTLKSLNETIGSLSWEKLVSKIEFQEGSAPSYFKKLGKKTLDQIFDSFEEKIGKPKSYEND